MPEVAKTLNDSRAINRGALADLLAEAQKIGILGDGDPQQMMEQFFALLWGDLMLGPVSRIAFCHRRAKCIDCCPEFAIKFFNRSGELVPCPLRAIKVLLPTGRSVVDHARPEERIIFSLLSLGLCAEAQGIPEGDPDEQV